MVGFENIFKRDMADVPYTVDVAKMENFIKTTKYLKKLEEQGKIILEYDDPATAFKYHSISIKWNLVDELVAIDITELREILKGLEGTITILPYDGMDWMIQCELYY